MTRHLLLTNDFPPKIGGIQNYLWELWRRLDPNDVLVYTTPYEGAAAFDAAQPFRVERSPEPWLGPFPHLVKRINRIAAEHEAEIVVVDPAVPLGMIAPHLELPYAVLLHGAEVTVPGRLPVVSRALTRVLAKAEFAITSGQYVLDEAHGFLGRQMPATVIPPGVDPNRFSPLESNARSQARAKFGIATQDIVISTVNRLVPRKGMNLLVDAVSDIAKTHPNVRLMIGGTGREESRLAAQIETLGAPVTMLGRISDAEVGELYGASDLMAMLCTSRWGGLEQEGFGIVFLEAACSGLPVVAGRSGGAAEAVVHNETGFVVDSDDPAAVRDGLLKLIENPELRAKLGAAGRQRALADFDYDHLARQLAAALDH